MVSNRRLGELDALRGVAALSVCLFHFGLLNIGCTGVDLFFIISGFVIYMSLIRSDSLKQFALLRAIRIYPTYWLSIIIVEICAIIFGHKLITGDLKFIIANIFLLQPMFRSHYLDVSYWTLYVEFLFYITIAVAWRLKYLRSVDRLVAGGLVIIAAMHLFKLFWAVPFYERLFVVARGLYPLITHWPAFAVGMILYKCHTSGMSPIRACLLILAVITVGLVHRDSVMINNFMTWQVHLAIFSIQVLVVLLATNGRLGILKLPIFTFVGYISYPLYLIHHAVGNNLIEALNSKFGHTIAIALALCSSVLLSILITYYFDEPVRKWLRRRIVSGAAPGK